MIWQNPIGLNYHKAKLPAIVLLNRDGTEIRYSWEEYSINSIYALKALETAGIKPGDFVGVIALNLPESFFIMSAIIMTGAVIVPINYPLIKESEHKELKLILGDCKPKLVAANQCLLKYLTDSGIDCVSFEDMLNQGQNESIQAVPPIHGVHEDNLLVMPYTSGTTGNPKGVMLNYKNISDRVKAISDVFGISKKERLLSYLPLGHISELVATFFGQLLNGYTVYFTEHIKELPENREKFRKEFPKILQKVKPTIFLAVPKIWSNLRRGIEKKTKYIPINLSRLGLIRNFLVDKIKIKLGLDHARFFVSASAKLNPEDKNFFAGLGMNIKDVYGQTETAGPLLIDGKIIGNTKVSAGKNDEITVVGDCMMMGYYKDNKIDTEAYCTGDIGLWQSGFVFCQGRLGDGFKNAQGEFISPAKLDELESRIKQLEGIQEAIVCGEWKPYLVALIFSSDRSAKLKYILDKTIPNMGEGLYTIRKFILIDPSYLEYTSTLKVKRKKIIKKFQANIDLL